MIKRAVVLTKLVQNINDVSAVDVNSFKNCFDGPVFL